MPSDDVRKLLFAPGHEPALREPRLTPLLTLFPLTRAVHRRCYKDRLEDHELFEREVRASVRPSSVVLDVGAGRGAPPAIVLRGEVARVIGVDAAPEIEENPNLDEWHVASVDWMPFLANGSIDFAYARYVAEHLEQPLLALRELRRVLKPGGQFLFITPNRRHYVPLIARSLGTPLHKAVNAARGRAPEDTFPTIYLLNSREQIEKLSAEAGFTSVEVASFECQPNYLTFHPTLFAVGVFYERIVNASDALHGFRGSLLARLIA